MTANKIVDTGTAMLAVLSAHGGGPIYTSVMEAELPLYGGDFAYIHDAAKHLRNQGTMVIATKARHLSTWTLAASEEEVKVWGERVRTEYFSELISQARALAGSNVKVVRDTRNHVVNNAIHIGADLGHSAMEVILMCEPVTP